MHKFFASLHGHKAGITWYQLSLFALALYGAWSVSVAIDMYYTTSNWIDKIGLQVFAWAMLLLFGSYLLTQWASLTHDVNEDTEDDTNSRKKKPWNWAEIGVYAGVFLMLMTEAAGRAAVFLRKWPDVSSAEIIFTTALTLYFCIPVFLGPAMSRQARKIRAEADSEVVKQAENTARDHVTKALQTRIEQMSDDDLLQRFSHLLPEEVRGQIEAPRPKGQALLNPQAEHESQNGHSKSNAKMN